MRRGWDRAGAGPGVDRGLHHLAGADAHAQPRSPHVGGDGVRDRQRAGPRTAARRVQRRGEERRREPDEAPVPPGLELDARRGRGGLHRASGRRWRGLLHPYGPRPLPNRDAPGFGFVSVGDLPEPIRTSEDGTWGVTADRGSCDFGVVDTAQVLQVGTANVVLPGSGPSVALTSVRRVPMTVGGKPIAARPTWVEISPVQGGAVHDGKLGGRVIAAIPGCEAIGTSSVACASFVRIVKTYSTVTDFARFRG